MDRKDHYYTCLNEEAGEVIQAACKCMRFSEEDGYPNTDRTNISDLTKELNDVLAVIELLQEEGVVFNGLFDRDQIETKKKRVKEWLEHSKKMGRF
jgi:NTP pyrophosphatase (non-canonical NTP hydrolase)